MPNLIHSHYAGTLKLCSFNVEKLSYPAVYFALVGFDTLSGGAEPDDGGGTHYKSGQRDRIMWRV